MKKRGKTHHKCLHTEKKIHLNDIKNEWAMKRERFVLITDEPNSPAQMITVLYLSVHLCTIDNSNTSSFWIKFTFIIKQMLYAPGNMPWNSELPTSAFFCEKRSRFRAILFSTETENSRECCCCLFQVQCVVLEQMFSFNWTFYAHRRTQMLDI